MIRRRAPVVAELCLRRASPPPDQPLLRRCPHFLPPTFRFSTSSYSTSLPPPQLPDNAGFKVVRPLMILPGRDAQFMPMVMRSLKVPVLTVKTYPQEDAIIYCKQDIPKSPVPLHFETPLTDESCHVQASTLVRHIFSACRDVEAVNAELDSLSQTQDLEGSCDKLVEAVVEGVSVYYTTFRFAVFAIVKVMIFDTFQAAHDISGRIVAKYSNCQHCFSDEEINGMETILFNQSPDQTVHAVIRTPIPLSRHVVAVPIYSSLVIEAELSASKHEISKGFAEFPVQGSGQFSKLIRGKRGLLLVDVTWSSIDPSLVGNRNSAVCEEESVDTQQ